MPFCFVIRHQNAKLPVVSISIFDLFHSGPTEIDVKNDNILPDFFFAKKLERFKISIGDGSFDLICFKDWFKSRPQFLIGNHESLRTLKLKLSSKPICSKKIQGINNVEYLCLDKLQGVKNVLFDLDTGVFYN